MQLENQAVTLRDQFKSVSDELLMEAGFIGCAEGPADLSATYKEELTRSLDEKLEAGLKAPTKKPRRPRKKS